MTPAICVRIKRRDGTILRTTSLDRDIEVTAPGYAGTYRSAAALAPTEMEFRATLAVDGLDVSGILSEATGIPERDVATGVYDMARVTVFETDWSAPSTVRPWIYGTLGNKTRTEEGRLRMEIRTIAQLLNQNQGEIYSTRCLAELGSGVEAPVLRRCGVSLAAFTVTEDVTSVTSARATFTVAGLAQAAGYFSKGTVEFLTGANAGAVREIRIHEAGGVLYLYDPVPFDIEVGDDVRVIAGCDKTSATCRDKFDNLPAFKGQPNIPGPMYMARNSTQQAESKPGGQSTLGAIGQFAATAIGAYFGPVGAFIGSLVGAALFPVSGGSTSGPRAEDLSVTSSTAGKRIPYIAGSYPVAGNVIAASEVIERETKRRVGKTLFSSGTRVTEYFYFFTGAISLCEGPISGIGRIWAWDELIYDAREPAIRAAEFEARLDQVSTFGGALSMFAEFLFGQTASLNAELEDVMTVYLGEPDQLPDPVIEGLFGGTPAFQGQAYVVFNELPLTKFGRGAQVPQFRFEVCRPLPEVETGDLDDDNVGDDVLAA